jgi:alanyl-tRNA synthetase
MNPQFLHQEDVRQLEFNATVVQKLVLPDGRIGVVLDRTYFYATGGGQEHDSGRIGDAQVLDVIKEETFAKVIHVLDRDIPPGACTAQIDRERRLRHMQHHTAQHLLTQCFIRLFNFETVSANINGTTPSTLDLVMNRALTLRELEQAEELANQVIYEDRPVKTYFVTPADLPTVPLRRPPSVSENIRIVEIDGYDYSACGGTHCPHTGMIGVLKIVKQERVNEKTRVHFVAGLQALHTLHNYHDLLTNLTAQLSVSIQEIPASIQRQSDQLKAYQKELQLLRSEHIAFEAQELARHAEIQGDYRVVVATYEGRPAAELRTLADALKKIPGLVALLAAYDNQKLSLVPSARQTPKSRRDLLNRVLTYFGGRGGGDAQIAQGGGSASLEQFRLSQAWPIARLKKRYRPHHEVVLYHREIWANRDRINLSLLLIIPYTAPLAPSSPQIAFWVFSLFLALFVCILLHELGHSLVSLAFGIKVRSITLWLLGGLAWLDHQPEKPLQALLISAAGPLVSIMIAVALAGSVFGGLAFNASDVFVNSPISTFLITLMVANISLVLFNLLPIYPLDGGQILRSGLEMVIGKRHADQATFVIALILTGLLLIYAIARGDFMLILVGLFILLGMSSLNRQALRLVSMGYSALLNRGAYHLMKQDYDQALAAYDQALRRQPKKANLYLGRAYANMYLLEYEKTQADIEQTLALEPDNVVAITLKGELLARKKTYDQANECFERAIQLKPDWPAPYVDKASTLVDQGDYAQAAAVLAKAMQLSPQLPVAYLLSSMLHFRQGNLASARQDGSTALKLASAGPGSVPEQALVFPDVFLTALEEELEWALDYYAQAIEKMPTSPLPYHGRADAYRVNQQPQLAVEDYTRAIQRSSQRLEPYLKRGIAYLALQIRRG